MMLYRHNSRNYISCATFCTKMFYNYRTGKLRNNFRKKSSKNMLTTFFAKKRK